MADIRELQVNIDMARELLTDIIEVKENLIDPEIVYMSRMLDNLLNEYNRLKSSRL